ncbi:MAG: hypothetical protein C5B59_13635 [Bacteroidetes bacterium]|nr:MAG: hypothetical protein C5B59_13635 [Bacteroidota bacterium]
MAKERNYPRGKSKLTDRQKAGYHAILKTGGDVHPPERSRPMAQTAQEKQAATEALEELEGSVQQIRQLLNSETPKLGKLKAFAEMARIESTELRSAITTYATNPRGPRESK